MIIGGVSAGATAAARSRRLSGGRPEGFRARYRVDVRQGTEAFESTEVGKRVRVRGSSGEARLPYDALILAQGASPVLADIAVPGAPDVIWTGDLRALHMRRCVHSRRRHADGIGDTLRRGDGLLRSLTRTRSPAEWSVTPDSW